jgi:hypothetical protein
MSLVASRRLWCLGIGGLGRMGGRRAHGDSVGGYRPSGRRPLDGRDGVRRRHGGLFVSRGERNPCRRSLYHCCPSRLLIRYQRRPTIRKPRPTCRRIFNVLSQPPQSLEGSDLELMLQDDDPAQADTGNWRTRIAQFNCLSASVRIRERI